MDQAAHQLGPFSGALPQTMRRHRQQPIFTYHNKETSSHNRDMLPRNVYYEGNPYALHISPTEPRLRQIVTSSRNTSHSRDFTETSSQRSCKVVRANGLRMIEKPKLIKVIEPSPLSQSRLNEQTRKFMQRQMELQRENKILKAENEFLKEKVKQLENLKNTEIKALNERIEEIEKQTQMVVRSCEQSEKEWKREVSLLQKNDSQ